MATRKVIQDSTCWLALETKSQTKKMAHGPGDSGGGDDVNGNHASAEDYGDDGGDGDDDGL